MAFNPDDKIQWENLAPTLQALLERKMEEHSRNYFNNHINIYVNQAISSSNSYTDSKISQLQSLLESKIASLGSGGGGTSSGGGGGNPPSGGGGNPPSGGGGNPPSGGGGNPPSGGGGNPPSGGGGTGSGGNDGNTSQEKITTVKFEAIVQKAGQTLDYGYYTSNSVNAKVYDTIYTYLNGAYGKTLISQNVNIISTATLSLGTTIESHNGPVQCSNDAKAYINAHINSFKSRIAHGTEATETIVTSNIS